MSETDPIQTSAQAPRRVQSDGVSSEAHSLPDQIAADKYLASKAAGKAARGFPLRIHQVRNPSALGR